MKKHIPNLITSLNLFSGCLACLCAIELNFKGVLLFVFLSLVFDFFDGMIARLLGISSAIGKELDSLADVISFGLVTSLAVYVFLGQWISYLPDHSHIFQYIPYLAFLIVIASAWRLAKFNLDERQKIHFVGLPTPANAMFWLCFIYYLPVTEIWTGCLVILLIFIFSWLMNSEIRMFSLKLTGKVSIQKSIPQIAVLIIAFICSFLVGLIAISIAILAYIVLSLFLQKRLRN